MKQRVLSGIRATGQLHLGNYFGAMKGMVELQNDAKYETLYMVADLHAMTTPFDSQKLALGRREVIIDYLAAGLDPEKSIIFIQSMVPEHLELAFCFSTVMTMARMQHLPTFKDKAKQFPHNVTMALLNYPVLMAADILIYQASLVPVGIDQEPHIEVAREVARKMNELYGLNFPEPQRFVTPGAYIPSLTGEGKMSKTVAGSYINLTDDLATITNKLKSIPTDSGTGTIETSETKVGKIYTDKTGKISHGVASLMTLVELFEGAAARKADEKAYQTTGLRYSEIKTRLAQAVYAELKPFQEKRSELQKNPDYVDEVIKNGTIQARKLAQETLSLVKAKMGIAA